MTELLLPLILILGLSVYCLVKSKQKTESRLQALEAHLDEEIKRGVENETLRLKWEAENAPYCPSRLENLDFDLDFMLRNDGRTEESVRIGWERIDGKKVPRVGSMDRIIRDPHGRVVKRFGKYSEAREGELECDEDQWELEEEFEYGCDESEIPTLENYFHNGHRVRWGRSFVVPKVLCISVIGTPSNGAQEVVRSTLNDKEETIREERAPLINTALK